MKSYKPYLSLTKTIENYILDVVLSASKSQTIVSIKQQEVEKDGTKYWGVIITLSTTTQLANGPEVPIFSTTVDVPLVTSAKYKTIKCIVEQAVPKGKMGPPADEETDVDFGDSGD